MAMDTRNLHGRALGIMAWQKSSARLVAVLVAVLLVAACKGTAVTGGGWGDQVDPTTGRPAGSGMERGGSGGGGY